MTSDFNDINVRKIANLSIYIKKGFLCWHQLRLNLSFYTLSLFLLNFDRSYLSSNLELVLRSLIFLDVDITHQLLHYMSLFLCLCLLNLGLGLHLTQIDVS